VTLWPWPLTFWPWVIPRYVTWVVNPCTKFGLDMTYRSRVRTTTIFNWPPIFTFCGGMGSNFKFHLFNPQKALPWPERRIMTYCAWGTGVCPEMRPVASRWRSKKDKLSRAKLSAQTTHVDVAPEILHVGSCPGGSYIFQVSWKSVEMSRSCEGRKSPSPTDLAHGLYNSLYYPTSRDFRHKLKQWNMPLYQGL